MKSDAYNEGRAAAANGRGIEYCPYTFNKVGVSVGEFNQSFRPLMDQWFAGWKGWLDANGLGFNFQPKKVKTKDAHECV